MGENLESEKKVICGLIWNGHDFDINISFIGGHFRKRVLLKLVKAIKLDYRKQVKLHRQDLILNKAKKQLKQEGEIENDAGTISSSKIEERAGAESEQGIGTESSESSSSLNSGDSKPVSRLEQIRLRNKAKGSRGSESS